MCMKCVSQIVSTIFVLLLLFLFKIKNIIMESSTSSSSSDEDEFVMQIVQFLPRPRFFRDRSNPLLEYEEIDFKQRFR